MLLAKQRERQRLQSDPFVICVSFVIPVSFQKREHRWEIFGELHPLPVVWLIQGSWLSLKLDLLLAQLGKCTFSREKPTKLIDVLTDTVPRFPFCRLQIKMWFAGPHTHIQIVHSWPQSVVQILEQQTGWQYWLGLLVRGSMVFSHVIGFGNRKHCYQRQREHSAQHLLPLKKLPWIPSRHYYMMPSLSKGSSFHLSSVLGSHVTPPALFCLDFLLHTFWECIAFLLIICPVNVSMWSLTRIFQYKPGNWPICLADFQIFCKRNWHWNKKNNFSLITDRLL